MPTIDAQPIEAPARPKLSCPRAALRALAIGRRPSSVLPLFLAVMLVTTGCSIPRLKQAPQIPPLPETSVIYDAEGRVITRLHAGENRTLVPLEMVPAVLRSAVIATEDERFYDHQGVDARAVLRAALANARSGRIVQGGSTITVQLVKNTITGNERTIDRKLQEAGIALQLENALSKDEILELYLNTVYFGHGAYGTQAAAKTYFSIPVHRLTLAQSAMLAALISSPSTFDPVYFPERARSRRDYVLRRMKKLGMIGEDEYTDAVAADLGLEIQEHVDSRYPAPYFVDYVIRWFLDNPMFGNNRAERADLLYRGGLRVHTTVDLRLQREAERAVNSILVRRKDPHAAMTVLDPRNGHIKAMVGGRDYFSTRDPVAKLNLATGGATGRQAGSAFKPFALVAALRQGLSPTRVYPAPGRISIPLPPGFPTPTWEVRNYDGATQGALTLEQATIASSNTVYAQLIMDVGPANVVRTAYDMGITSRLNAVPAAVLGSNDVNTLEMASAYGTLAAMGKHVPPVAVTHITASDGEVVYRNEVAPKQVIEPGVAWTADQILQKVVQEGTGTAANLGRPVAGKTGTSQQWTNAWFVGFVPQMVAAVWVGFPKGAIPMVYPRVRISNVLGGTWPAQIWRAFMVNATRGMPARRFERPEFGYVSVAVDVTRNCLPNQWTLPGDIRSVQFISGTQPTMQCTEPSGPQLIELPSVVGLSSAEAESLLSSYAFEVTVETVASGDVAEETVLAQSPSAGTPTWQGTTVTLTVAERGVGRPGIATVPSVLNLSVRAAVDVLQAAGLGVNLIRAWECTPPSSCGAVANRVWSQDPDPGVVTEPGTRVTISANPVVQPTPSPSPSPTASASPSPSPSPS